MEYITSRGFELPTDISEMESLNWFNMWNNRNFPYSELVANDTLYWFDTKVKKLVWKTEVISVERYPYSDKKLIFERYYEPIDSKYYKDRPVSGYFVGYKIRVIEKVDIIRPDKFKFPRIGWVSVDNENALKWFNRKQVDDQNTLDDNIEEGNKSVIEKLAELNQKMQNVSPERIEKLVSMTIRKDTKIIAALKEFVDFKCQYPNCGQRIIKKGGGFYIEVAHIKPVSQKGQSILGNLLVLCPNHHKEFDFGDLKIIEQTQNRLVGKLNGNNFIIDLKLPKEYPRVKYS